MSWRALQISSVDNFVGARGDIAVDIAGDIAGKKASLFAAVLLLLSLSCLCASCAWNSRETAFEVVRIRQSNEETDKDMKLSEHYLNEVRSNNEELEKLKSSLSTIVYDVESKAAQCEGKIRALGVKVDPNPPAPRLPGTSR